MKCKDCISYTPSELMAGGRCKHKGKIACFPDVLCGINKFEKKKKRPVPVDNALPPDPQDVWS